MLDFTVRTMVAVDALALFRRMSGYYANRYANAENRTCTVATKTGNRRPFQETSCTLGINDRLAAWNSKTAGWLYLSATTILPGVHRRHMIHFVKRRTGARQRLHVAL